jgi:hypothetical protein
MPWQRAACARVHRKRRRRARLFRQAALLVGCWADGGYHEIDCRSASPRPRARSTQPPTKRTRGSPTPPRRLHRQPPSTKPLGPSRHIVTIDVEQRIPVTILLRWWCCTARQTSVQATATTTVSTTAVVFLPLRTRSTTVLPTYIMINSGCSAAAANSNSNNKLQNLLDLLLLPISFGTRNLPGSAVPYHPGRVLVSIPAARASRSTPPSTTAARPPKQAPHAGGRLCGA